MTCMFSSREAMLNAWMRRMFPSMFSLYGVWMTFKFEMTPEA